MQLSVPITEEVREALHQSSQKYGLTDPIFASEILRSVLTNPKLLDSLQISASPLNSLVELTISSAASSPSGKTFKVNSFIDEQQWNLLDTSQKRTIAMKLAKHIKDNPDRYSILKVGTLNVYTVK